MTYSDKKQIERLLRISNLYYNQGLSQKNISDLLHIHRTEISRLLKRAKDMGIVKVTINNPLERETVELEDFLCQNFHLKKAIVSSTEKNSSYNDDLESVSISANNLINELIKNGSVIGLSWGETLKNTVSNFSLEKQVSNVSVVPLIGSPMGQLDISCQANHLVHQMCEKIPQSNMFYLDSPVFINSESAMREILATATNRNSVQMWDKVDIALVGIGSAKMTDNYNWREFYKRNGSGKIYQKSMVGDVLSQSFSINGDECQEIYPNLVGTSLSKLRKIKNVVGIAAGEKKVEALIGCLNAQLLDYLVITDEVAKIIKKIVLSQM
ncbi:sugar-binding transcriptional regulator [Liquorilactobacillus sp.]|uniref:sugar-binding transcriptional regulator n=1 Tax=Liquorilactobacillus sp. TaxID=2767923 RepID=UPI0039E995E3